MGLLNNFEEEKTTLQKDDVIELMGVLKTKEAELNLELEHTKKLNKLSQETLNKIEIVLEKIVNQAEKNEENFIKEFENLKNQNKLFTETIEKSDFLRDLKRNIKEQISLIQKEKEEKLIEIKEETKNEIIRFRNSYGFREVIAWLLTGTLCILWAFSHFTYKGEIREYQEESKKQYRTILNILAEDTKFWYSNSDKKVYLDNFENIRKAKEEENKKK